jgi:hypothetical protein
MEDSPRLQPRLVQRFLEAVRTLGTRSEPRQMGATLPPRSATCSQRLPGHLGACRPCRTRTRIRALKCLAELQGTWLDLIEIDDRVALAQSGLVLWKLREDAVQLVQQLETALEQVPECPQSVPQTESDLERDRR